MTRFIQNIDSSAINSVPQIFAIFQGAEFIFRSLQQQFRYIGAAPMARRRVDRCIPPGAPVRRLVSNQIAYCLETAGIVGPETRTEVHVLKLVGSGSPVQRLCRPRCEN